jgi:hypothetical protein
MMICHAIHFVGFKGEEFVRALRVWRPDFIHRLWDARARADIAPGDTVIFANYEDRQDRPFSYNDSEHF